MSIVLSIGIYYKIQNNKYNNTVTGANYESYQYRKLRDKYPNFYFYKIKNIKKKLIKGKRLNLAQKQIMKEQRKKASELKMSKEKPTKKQIYYYDKLCKQYNIKQEEISEKSRLDLKNIIGKILYDAESKISPQKGLD